MSAPGTRSRLDSEAAWHDVECGSYAADLPLWEQLAAAHDGELLDLGAGTGRVTLHLAARGHRICAVERDPELLAVLAGRAAERGLEVRTLLADVRELRPDPRHRPALAIAPMQLFHLLEGPANRRRALAALGAALAPGATVCIALLDDAEPLQQGSPAPLPDVRELEGWVHSSLPLEVRVPEDGAPIELHRLRQLVSPEGGLTERQVVVRLDRLDPGQLEREARAAGLRPRGRIEVPPTPDHVGSVVVRLETPR